MSSNTWRTARAPESTEHVSSGNACQTADQARNGLQFDQLDVEAVAEALASLPTPLRQATWLRDVDNASYTEIAATLNLPVETVLSHISRGRRTLYERLSARPDTRACTTITTPAAPQAVLELIS